MMLYCIVSGPYEGEEGIWRHYLGGRRISSQSLKHVLYSFFTHHPPPRNVVYDRRKCWRSQIGIRAILVPVCQLSKI